MTIILNPTNKNDVDFAIEIRDIIIPILFDISKQIELNSKINFEKKLPKNKILKYFYYKFFKHEYVKELSKNFIHTKETNFRDYRDLTNLNKKLESFLSESISQTTYVDNVKYVLNDADESMVSKYLYQKYQNKGK